MQRQRLTSSVGASLSGEVFAPITVNVEPNYEDPLRREIVDAAVRLADEFCLRFGFGVPDEARVKNVHRRVRPTVVEVVAAHGWESLEGKCALDHAAFDEDCDCGVGHDFRSSEWPQLRRVTGQLALPLVD